MANQVLFRNSQKGKTAPETDIVNEAGGAAYKFAAKHALAQYASTGVFNNTFYTTAKGQLDTVKDLLDQVDNEFIAKTAVYTRNHGFMKDMPAFLLAYLTTRGDEGLHFLNMAFSSVMNNGKMIRNFVQFIRSGQLGRRSLGSGPKNLVRKWIDNRNSDRLYKDSVGNDPSIADVIKMVHPKPSNKERQALYGYIIGKECDYDVLPDLVKQYESFKQDLDGEVPDVPFQLISSLDINDKVWVDIAKNARWQMTRMNLNSFQRHGVFKDEGMVKLIADRLKNPEEIHKAMVFPYQLFNAYMNIEPEIPFDIREALQDALEIAIDNVPSVDGNVVVCPDVSGSMGCPVTGYRHGSTSSATCHDISALIAAAVLRKNPRAKILPFERHVCNIELNPRDSVATNAEKLSRIGGGGTNCAAPLVQINKNKDKVDAVIFVSDNQSWINTDEYNYYGNSGTEMMREWNKIKVRNPKAKLVCIDIQPYNSTQVSDNDDILNIGGFSDSVFNVVSSFVKGGKDHWVDEINKIKLG